MMRFFWKKGSGVPGQQAGKAKILRVKKIKMFDKIYKKIKEKKIGLNFSIK